MNNRNLSANTLFHFTSSVELLKSIIENGLYPRYCRETIYVSAQVGCAQAEVCMPMISFCDIPLSQICDHVTKYGRYAIGLTKEWGLKKGVCPVLYYREGDRSYDAFLRSLDLANKTGDDFTHNGLVTNLAELGFLFKLYEGISPKNGKITRFYDEREWRYIPPLAQTMPDFLMDLGDFSDATKRQEKNNRFEKYHLTFEPSDIRYVVVRGQDDIGDIVQYIESHKIEYSPKDVVLLTAKIITTKQILDDF